MGLTWLVLFKCVLRWEAHTANLQDENFGMFLVTVRFRTIPKSPTIYFWISKTK